MKTLLLAIMVLGLTGTAFAQRGGNFRGNGHGMRGGEAHAFRGGERHEFRGGYRGGYYGHRDGFRRGYGYGHYYGRYGYRPWRAGFGYYNYPVVYGPGYYPYCDPAWGPCYYRPYVYRPGVAVSVGVGVGGGVVVGAGWRHFAR